MTEWRPWIIGIWSLAIGAVLFFVGYFSMQLEEALIPRPWSKTLISLSIVFIVIHLSSGMNKLTWKIRGNFSDEESKALKRLRKISGPIALLAAVGTVFPLLSGFFGSLIGSVPHDLVVAMCALLVMIALLGGGLVRAAEFKLLKQSSTRTEKSSKAD